MATAMIRISADVSRKHEDNELANVAEDHPSLLTAAIMEWKESSMRIMAAACGYSGYAQPMAMPISAFFRAGASFTPSPVMATT